MSGPDQDGPAAPVRADLPSPTKMLKGRTVFRVVWKLHTDVLVGYCWCGAGKEDIDPIALWEWLLAHPDTHGDHRTGPDAPDPGTPASDAPDSDAPAPDPEMVDT